MYKTHFFLKFVAHEKVGNNAMSIIAKAKLSKPIRKPRLLEVHDFVIGYSGSPAIMTCSLVDESHCFSNVIGRNNFDMSGKVRPSKICFITQREITNNTYAINQDVINDFELVAFFLREERFNDTEIEKSFVHIIIYHDEK